MFPCSARRRSFEDAQADVEADEHEHDVQQERDPPAPFQKGIAGQGAESEHRQVGEEQARRHTELRPGRNEAAVCAGLRPLHRQEHRSAPLAADAHALNEAQRRQQHRAPDADAVVSRHQRHGESGQAHEQQRRDQRRLAADAIAVVAEDECSDGPRQETDREDPERLQGADQRLGIGEVQPGEHQPRHGGVKKEVVPLDGGPYRAGDDGARELSAGLRTLGPHRSVRHRAVLYPIVPPSPPPLELDVRRAHSKSPLSARGRHEKESLLTRHHSIWDQCPTTDSKSLSRGRVGQRGCHGEPSWL
jgi:hypothetical protein